MTDTAVDLTFDVDTTPLPHLRCCVTDVFYCGAAYHPEAATARPTPDSDDDGVCGDCLDEFYDGLCPKTRPSHQHCPLDIRKVCPT